ncbi:MAG: metal ABC transporter substrate-binding protein, partial [Desulfomonilia bacterium]
KRILTIGFVYLVAAILWGVFPPSASGANPPDKIKVGYLAVTGHAKTFVAEEQGFFRMEGLN